MTERLINNIFLSTIDADTSIAVYCKDTARRYTFVNRRFAELIGRSQSDVVGRTDEELDRADACARGAADDRVLQLRQVLTQSEELHCAGGNRLALEALRAPLWELDGTCAGVCWIASGKSEPPDAAASDRLSLLLRLQQARLLAQHDIILSLKEHEAHVEAARICRVKDEFLTTLSHELRTPLNAILGWSQLLISGELDSVKTNQAMHIIERNARAETQLVEDLLDVSNIVRGNLRLDIETVDMAEVVKAACDGMRLAAPARGVRLEVEIHGEQLIVRGDSRRLQQAAWNLVSNAIKFTPRGGEVTVTLSREANSLLLAVTDTGTGIKPEFLPHVFERFRQADSSFTRNFGGLGLGLAIVRELALLHGGSVDAVSGGEGQGSTFTIKLPLAAAPTPPPPRKTLEQARAATDLQDVRVLIIDDDADARDLISTILRLHQAEVRVASSAEVGLLILGRWLPDVLISDISMPTVNGYELIRRVRELPAALGGLTPALALTAYAGDADRHRAIMEGYQMHMAKPLEPEILVNALVGLLAPSPRRSSRQLASPAHGSL